MLPRGRDATHWVRLLRAPSPPSLCSMDLSCGIQALTLSLLSLSKIKFRSFFSPKEICEFLSGVGLSFQALLLVKGKEHLSQVLMCLSFFFSL